MSLTARPERFLEQRIRFSAFEPRAVTIATIDQSYAMLEPLLRGRRVVGVFGFKSPYADPTETSFWCELAERVGAQIARAGCHLVCGGQGAAGIQSSVSAGFASVLPVTRPIVLPGGVEKIEGPASVGVHPEQDARRRPLEKTLHYAIYSGLDSYRGQHPNANANRNTLEARLISGAVIFPGGTVGTTNELAWSIHFGKPWIYVGSEKHWQEHLANLTEWARAGQICPTTSAVGTPDWLSETRGRLTFLDPGGAAPDLGEFFAQLSATS